MSQNYLLSDSVTRIRNAQKVFHSSVLIKYSKVVQGTLQVLLGEGYIKSIKYIKIKNKEYIRVGLKYIKNSKAVINNIIIISKPGKRTYQKCNDIKNIYNNLGISIISTPLGIMSNVRAKKSRVGGEVICKIF